MKTAITLATVALAFAAPAFAQDKTTLEYVTTKGTVVKANAQGTDLELPNVRSGDDRGTQAKLNVILGA